MTSTKLTASAPPSEPRKTPANPGPFLFFLGGLVFVAASVAFLIGSELLPGIREYVDLAGQYGFDASVFFVGGAILFALGIVSRFHRATTHTLLQPGLAEQTLGNLSTELSELTETMNVLREDQTSLRQEIGSLRHEVHKHHGEALANSSKDGLFRLAASLDQLGARVDEQIEKATSILQENVYEVSSLVEASRDYLQESLEETAAHIADSSAKQAAAMPMQQLYAMPPPAVYAAPVVSTASSETQTTPEAPAVEEQRCGISDGRTEYEDEDELHIIVDLDDDGSENEDPGLGLLDELDDYHPGADAASDAVPERPAFPEPDPAFTRTPANLRMAPPNQAAQPDVQDKLDRIKSLLTNEELDRALRNPPPGEAQA